MLTLRSTSWWSANSFEACCPRIRNLRSTTSPISHSCSLPKRDFNNVTMQLLGKLIFNYKRKKETRIVNHESSIVSKLIGNCQFVNRIDITNITHIVINNGKYFFITFAIRAKPD